MTLAHYHLSLIDDEKYNIQIFGTNMSIEAVVDTMFDLRLVMSCLFVVKVLLMVPQTKMARL